MTQTIRAGVFGASGYAGMDLVELLTRHPHVELVFGTSSTYAGDSITGTDLTYIPHEDASLDGVDVVFLALPHTASAPMAARALQAGVKVIDFSADLRLDTPEAFERWYNTPHPNPELLPVPYGLSEINRANLTNINVVAVPGCYPATTLLGLYPLLKAHALDKNAPIIVDAKSGVSGAGRSPSPTTHFVEVFGNLSPYKVGRVHRHVGEIDQEIAKIDPNTGTLIFVPHLLPVDRGLLASIYVTLNDSMTSDQAQALYDATYGSEPLVDVLPAGQLATIKHVARKNHCAISVSPITEKHLLVTSVTDNLRKGAAGQAVQCFNLMFGYPETTALL
jgi:N-acetyl-gamma-glutamyl-phosphate reductase